MSYQLILKYKSIILLFLIIILASFLRIYKIDQIPPSISWDEAAVGYNAYTIANWGKDEWGKTFPLIFTSFEDDKHPVYVYFTAISVKILGLSDFSMRLPTAIFGVMCVMVVFYLTKIIFASNFISLISALFVAVSPYSIQFSRFNHQANFALFFWMLGLLFFLKAIRGKKIFLPFSFFSFGISLFSYHSSLVVVIPLIVLLIIIYFKDLLKIKKYFLISILIMIFFGLIMYFNPALLGIARMNQTAVSKDEIFKTFLYKKTNDEILGKIEFTYNQYLLHLDPKYLFLTGGANKKFSTQAVGEFYPVDAPLILVGFLGLLWGIVSWSTHWKTFLVLLVWALLAPLPASLVAEAPHPGRAMFMMGSWNIIAAYGLYLIVTVYKKLPYRILITGIFLIILSIIFYNFITDYYKNYANKYSIDWQYGMKQAVGYVKDHNGYFQVYTTDIRFQPYIFFLYYLKTPLPEFRDTVYYNTDIEKRKYNLVSVFDDYHFGDWDPIESMPNSGVLYIISPSQYDGLRHKDIFDVKKHIKYLDGSDAFFLVSYP